MASADRMTALPEVAQGSLEEGLAKALLPHAQLRLFKGSVALLSAYAAGEINVFGGGGATSWSRSRRRAC